MFEMIKFLRFSVSLLLIAPIVRHTTSAVIPKVISIQADKK